MSPSSGPVGARTRRDLQHQLNEGTLLTVLMNLSQDCSEVQLSISHSDLETPKVQTVTVSGVDLYVRWATVQNATEYMLVIEEDEQESHQQPIVRTVEGDNYLETDLRPWTTYCITLAAKNAMDQSSYSSPVCRKTGGS